MENRFREMSDYLGGLSMRSTTRGVMMTRGTAQGYPSAVRRSWAKSLSAAQRVLVILIENGGIDLRIPDAVDAVIGAIPGSSLIPDALRKTIREVVASAINEPLKRASKDLLESVELVANRYAAAKPDLYGDVVILQNGTASYEALKRQLIASSKAGQLIDLLILTHGDTNYIAVGGGIDGDKIRAIRTEFGRPLSIRSVYMMNCVGSSLNKAWLDAGAKTSSGTKGDNLLPEPTMFFFWNNWKNGQSFETAVKTAYLQTVDLINQALSSLAVPGLDVRAFQFVKDSEPVVDGQGSIAIGTDDLVFSQSVAPSRLNDTRRAPLLRALDDGGTAAAGATSLSASGVDFIKQFEGFFTNLYNDPAGHCTVGYGTLVHKGNCDGSASEQPYAGGVSKNDATQLLAQEVSKVAPTIVSAASRGLTQNQFDALASFVYNVGVSAFQQSTLAKRLRDGKYADVPAELKKWTKARVGGKLVDLPGLVRRRGAEADLWQKSDATQTQSLTLACLGVSLSTDKWEAIAQKVFGYSSYDEYVAKEFTSTTFFGQTIDKVGPQLIEKLQTAEATLRGKGQKSAPAANSGFRPRAGMHGLGLAVDFAILEDPYILNEWGEAALDKELLIVYDHIADFILGMPGSNIAKLRKGRAAFNGSIGDVYDALRAESDAMKKYFLLMTDAGALAACLANDWPALHSGKCAPDFATIQKQMQNDYETLGGADASGAKKPTGKAGVDRPFAPTSGRGAGDPATGFLNLERDFVLALTDAGLAWGAIDMGGASGDIMHFDCRLGGKGQQAFALMVRTA